MIEAPSFFNNDSAWNLKKTFKLKIKVLKWNKLQSNQNSVQIWIPEPHEDILKSVPDIRCVNN